MFQEDRVSCLSVVLLVMLVFGLIHLIVVVIVHAWLVIENVTLVSHVQHLSVGGSVDHLMTLID